MQRDCDVVVIGGGVVGLAAAAALAGAGRRVWLLERHAGLGRETSSRNSEVVHAGIHYPVGSLKAELCVRGRQQLYARCERLGLPVRRTGKWIVAQDDAERGTLEEVARRGRACGVEDLELVEGAELARCVPGVRGVAALHSPQTGIVDAHALCLSLAAELEAADGVVALRHAVEGIEPQAEGYRVEARSAGGEVAALRCAAVVNAAGLAGDRVAARAGLDVDSLGYRIHPCKGDYFSLAPGLRLSLDAPVYPVATGGPGLGIHVTPDLAGRLRFGPDAHYVDDAEDLRVDPAKAEAFTRAVQRYLPELPAGALVPDQAGVRPKLAAPGESFRDFVVAEESAAGLPGFVSCLGIESPGLTAALAIGARVRELLASL